MDPDAVVCNMEIEGFNVVHNSIEMCREIKNATYIDDSGEYVVGSIVAIY